MCMFIFICIHLYVYVYLKENMNLQIWFTPVVNDFESNNNVYVSNVCCT